MITVRILWGLLTRTTDGLVVYERWFWGAFLRVRPARLVLHSVSPETKAAFAAIGGQLPPQGEAGVSTLRLENQLAELQRRLQDRMDAQANHLEQKIRSAFTQGVQALPAARPDIPDLTDDDEDEDSSLSVFP